VLDLPGPRGVVDLPGPRGVADLPTPRGVADLPTPRATADLPRPARGPAAVSAGPPTLDADLEIPLDLDAPDVDDAPLFEANELKPRADGSIDLPTPRADGSIDLPTPRGDSAIDLPTPRVDGEAAALEGERADEPAQDFTRGLAAAATTRSSGGAPVVDGVGKSKSKRKKLLLAGGGVALVAVIGAAVFALDLVGAGGGKRPALDAKLTSARRALAEDTLSSFRRAATELKPLSTGEKPSEEAALVEAQAHLLQAQLGIANELAAAKTLLDRPSATKPPLVERQRADALRALATGDLATSRKLLKVVLGKTPADPVALCYLGWTELAARDLEAADAAFARAVSAEPARAQAMYGLGLTKERAGENKPAVEAYAKVLAASPEHFRARLGTLRLAAGGLDAGAAAKIEALLSSKASSLAPREIAEAQVSLGLASLAAGRWDEAEEHLKKAAASGGEIASSHVAWDARVGLSRARVLAGKSAESIEDLRKLVALDLRGVEPRLLLAEALIEKKEPKEAEALLAAVEVLRAKEPRIALLRGRLLLSRTIVGKDERERAVTLFRDATTADPSSLQAWSALAKTLHELGRTPQALEALGTAAEALSSDPRGAAVLGAAYLSIGKPADAEMRFRAVLAASNGKSSLEQLPVWIGLGEALEAQEKLTEAQTTYAEAQKLAPSSTLLVEKQARIATRTNRLDEARKLFDEAMERGQPTVSLRVAAAELALKTGRSEDARKLVESAIKDDDRSAPATLLLARIELDSGHAEDAVGLARRAAMLEDLPEAHLILGQVLERTNKLEGAAAEYNFARRPPTTDLASLGRARILVRMGATRDALVELESLAKVAALRAEVLVLQGDCYADLQQPDKARHAYEDAVKAAPQLADAAFKLGRSLLDAGRRQPGVTALERAVKLAKAQTSWLPEAHLLLGDAHRVARSNDAAVLAYRKYLELAPPTAPMRAEAQRQISLLGGGK